MSLLDYQRAMGQLVRSPNREQARGALDTREQACLEALKASRGYRFTAEVQRSWCIARLRRAAAFTLSVLPEVLGVRLLNEWTDLGGGTSSFFASESEAFLTFIARNLPDPSHELSVCRLERATLRANEQARHFTPPDLSQLTGTTRILRGPFADMVVFQGDPHYIIRSLTERRSPREGSNSAGALADPLACADLPSAHETGILFAPGIPGLQQIATPVQRGLWNLLAAPLSLGELLEAGWDRREIDRMLQWRCLEALKAGQALRAAEAPASH